MAVIGLVWTWDSWSVMSAEMSLGWVWDGCCNGFGMGLGWLRNGSGVGLG